MIDKKVVKSLNCGAVAIAICITILVTDSWFNNGFSNKLISEAGAQGLLGNDAVGPDKPVEVFHEGAAPGNKWYRYKKWGLWLGRTMSSATLVANYDFSSPLLIPFELKINCVNSLYSVLIQTNNEKLHPNSSHLGERTPFVSFDLRFKDGEQYSLSVKADRSVAWVKGSQDHILLRLMDEKNVFIDVTTKFDDGSGSTYTDTFDLDGISTAIAVVNECKPRVLPDKL